MIVCLIYPPTRHMIRTNVPSVVDEVTGCYPPLGILYVAGAIESEGRHEVHVVDAVAENLDDAALEARIRKIRPAVVGIEAITFSIVDAYGVARLVKKADPSIRVVMGGPHANLYPEETLGLAEVDFVLLGEGEGNIRPFLEAVEGKRDMATVPGVVFRDGAGAIRKGPPNPLIEDLDSLPMPARHLLDTRLYSSVLGRGKFLTTMMSSRGCPARCLFCDRPHLGKKFRSRSARSVVDEMVHCRDRFGVDEFFFYDDTFTIDRKRVLDICREVRDRKLNVFWDIRARIAGMDREMLETLRAAGCIRIHFGIESGNEKVLKILRKGVDLEEARQVFRWCREAGIESLAYFMIGSPGEGLAEVEDTIRYALSIDCDYIHVAVTTPFPGTELYRLGLQKGLYPTDHWAAFARNPTPAFTPPLWEECLTRDQSVGAMRELYRRFYRRPGYIARRLCKVRSFRELARKARTGIRLLFG